MVTVFVHCPRCDSDKVYRHGLSPTHIVIHIFWPFFEQDAQNPVN
ncbi:IS1 family transposase [Symbiopectobacterium sp. Eva_TO]